MKSFKKIFLMLTSFAMVVGTLLIGGGIKKTEQVEAADGYKLIYSTGFESADGYTASTTYNNTTAKKYKDWKITSGAVTKTSSSVLTGSQGVQMRYYSRNKTTFGILQSVNTFSGIDKIEFNAKYKTTKPLIDAYVSLDCIDWKLVGQTSELTTTKTKYSLVNNTDIKSGYVKLVVNYSNQSTITDKSDTFVDDLEIYKDCSCKVSFELNGGKLSSGDTQIDDIIVVENSSITNPGDLEHSTDATKKFVGWYYTDSNGVSQKWDFATDKVTSNLTLTAKWGYEVTINPANGGATEVKTVLEGTKISTLVPTEEPEKGGYTFSGWKKVIGDATTDITETDEVKAKLEIIANWTEVKTPLVFVEAGKEFHSDTVEYYVDEEFTLSAVVQHATPKSYNWETDDDSAKPVLTILNGSLEEKEIRFKANKIGEVYFTINVAITESNEPISYMFSVKITHPIMDISTSAWLGISYDEIEVETITYNIGAMATENKWAQEDNIGVTKDFPTGRTDLKVTATNGTTNTRYWDNDWRFYKGSTLKIESTDKKISSITINGTKKVVNNNIFTNSFSETFKITEIIVELEGSLTFTSIRARFGITIPKEMYQFDKIASENVSFNVYIDSSNTQVVKMTDANKTVNDDGSITYVVSVTGIPLANCKDVIHVVPTITINGHSYELKGTAYSVYEMVNAYLAQDAFKDNAYLNALKANIDAVTNVA